MKRYFALLFATVMLASLLYGCSAAADVGSNGALTDKMEYSQEIEAPEEAGSGVTSSSDSTAAQPATNQKLVRTIWLEAETEELDTLLSQVDEKIGALSGYAESRNIHYGSGKNTGSRSASLVIRIPVAQLDQFVTHVTGISNVVSSNETADDITLKYVATQSRVTALQTEHDRLLELLEKAESMSDLLEIEKRLTQVRAELEEVTSMLKLYDNKVNYGTVHLELREVKEYTDVTEPETVWQRIGKGFMESLSNLGELFTELFVALVVGLPYLAVLGVIAVIVLLIIKLCTRKKK